jgi:heterodisulfide reductase subunit A
MTADEPRGAEAQIPAPSEDARPSDAVAGAAAQPRIGVYVCHCGGNISDVVDVQEVADRAAELPGVAVARTNMFMCSDPGQNAILEDIEKEHLDRVVVAACSPKLHELTFRGVLERAGLNPYLYEPVNIREQVSWATGDKAQATVKAAALVRAAVEKARRLAPLEPIGVGVKDTVAVIGGGVAGLRAAADLAAAGLKVALVERGDVLGGNVAVLERLFPTEEAAADVVTRLTGDALRASNVTIYTQTTVEQASGYVGNFSLTLRQNRDGLTVKGAPDTAVAGEYVPFRGYVIDGAAPDEPATDIREEAPGQAGAADDRPPEDEGREITVEAGAILVATGFEHYTPAKGEYGYQRLPQVVTLPDFIKWLSAVEPGPGAPEHDGVPVRSVAFVHCVGSRQVEGVNKPQADGKINEYCSRVCCTAILQAVCELQEKRPDVATIDFYQDVRTYGRGHEDYYERASKGGTVFVRFAAAEPPAVSRGKQEGETALVRCKDGLTWGEEVEAAVDLVVLGVGMVPADVSSLVDGLKLPVGTDRFLLEVHPKLRPVEPSVNGVLLAGAAQGPKDVTETTASASAAAAKAVALLGAGHVDLDPFVAHVDATLCAGHGACVAECPYPGAVEMQDYEDGRRRAVVNPALCVGCGACVAVCPARAIDLAGWTLDQYDAMVEAIVETREVPAR